MLDIGKLRHRITFLKPLSEEKNECGEIVPVYEDYRTVWGAVEPKTGREYDESQKLRAETTYNILVRYIPGITADMKIRYKEHEFDIISVLNIEMKNEQLKIVASEADRNGKD